MFAENIDIPYEVITWPRRHGEERGSLPDIWRTASRHSHALGKGTFSQTTGLSLRPHGVPYSLPEQQRFASLVWQHQHGSHQAFPWQVLVILTSFCDLVHVQSVADLFAKQLYNALNVHVITKRRALDG